LIKYVKTSIYFTTYDEGVAEEILNYLRSNYEVIESRRSEVVRELYYVSLKGEHPEISSALEGKVIWFKVDLLEFT